MTALPKPTKRQLEIHAWIGGYVAKHGYSPTLRELCKAFGFRNVNGAVCHLEPLRKKGLVDWVDGQARTLRAKELNA
jgi:repressor LexA